MLGYAGGQLLRFAGNLLLTRLLFPEAFGLMAIVASILTGVTMISDLGISQGIVVHKSGADPSYLNTAWTLQIIKGVLMALALILLSPLAAAHFNQPDLVELMMIVALVALISSFGSTKLALAQRNITSAKRRMLVDICCQAAGIAATCIFAYFYPEPSSLAWGNCVSAVLAVACSHLLFSGAHNRLGWHRESVGKIFSLGGIVLIGSVLTFLLGEGSKLLYASFLDIKTVGLIGLAAGLSGMMAQLMSSVSAKVFLPAYAEVARTGDTARLRKSIDRTRMFQIIPCWIFSALIAIFGSHLVTFLYDDRYADAGKFLQIQALGGMAAIISTSYFGVLYAIGRPALNLYVLIAQIFFVWAGMLLGYYWFGPIGVVIGAACADWCRYPVTAVIYHRLQLLNFKFDAIVLACSLAVVLFIAFGMKRFSFA